MRRIIVAPTSASSVLPLAIKSEAVHEELIVKLTSTTSAIPDGNLRFPQLVLPDGESMHERIKTTTACDFAYLLLFS